MGMSSDQSAAKGAQVESEAAKTAAGESDGVPGTESQRQSIDDNLTEVASPKLAAAQTVEPSHADAGNDAPEGSPSTAAAAALPSRTSPFTVLAAAIALTAAVGSFVGSLTASGIARLLPAAAPSSRSADASGVLQAMKAQLAELSAIKSNLDGTTRSANTQLAKIADRLDRVERAEAAPATTLAHIADTVDRVDRRNTAAPDTTGSITPAAPPLPPVPPASEPRFADRILPGWTVQDVHGGRALVESRYGGFFVVGAGSFLPGLGPVETVKRQDGQWVVVTARGVITSGR